MDPARRALFIAAASAALAPTARASDLPAPLDTVWSSEGGRRLPVLVRWPAADAGPGGWPLIVYSHGLGGSRQGGALWGEAWARAGFAVVHLEHVGSNLDAVRRERNLREVTGGRQLMERLQDVRHALDEVVRLQAAGSPGWRQVRPRAFGMAGHSFGAHTTLGMAGQAWPGAGGVDEPRLAAFIAFSPTLPPGDARKALAGVTRPLLCLTGTEDADVIGNGATPDRRAAVYEALPAGHKAILLLEGADHMTFGGTQRRAMPWQRRPSSALDREQAHHALVARISTDWWQAFLQDDAAARTRLRRPDGLAAGDRWQQG